MLQTFSPSTPASNMRVVSEISVFFFFIFLFFPVSSSSSLFADSDSRKTPPPAPDPLLPPLSDPPLKPEGSPFRPSIAVVVGVLTTTFSLTFLLLLYAKHCKRGGNGGGGYHGSAAADPNSRAEQRKNSGIDRTVIESLPIFRFSSLSGQKDGLECAVCLSRFEPSEVLRLLPKCKHAFHVECVDTWLDAHSTCPLCRYRVDPEDILLIEDADPILSGNKEEENAMVADDGAVGEEEDPENVDIESGVVRRVSGRHSSAGERASGRSGFGLRTTSFRRSLDSSSKKRTESSVAVGCFDRYTRKDGLLLNDDNKTTTAARFEHRIIVGGPNHQRWSDLQPSDLLYLSSEMIITSESRRFSTTSGSRPKRVQEDGGIDGCGRNVIINGRSMSEITGLNRFSSRVNETSGNNNNNSGGGGGTSRSHRLSHHNRRGQAVAAGVASRWLAWVSSLSQSQSESDSQLSQSQTAALARSERQ